VQGAEPVERSAGTIEDPAKQRFADRNQFGAVDPAPAGGWRSTDLWVLVGGLESDYPGSR
jgi:hypothetical protein